MTVGVFRVWCINFFLLIDDIFFSSFVVVVVITSGYLFCFFVLFLLIVVLNIFLCEGVFRFYLEEESVFVSIFLYDWFFVFVNNFVFIFLSSMDNFNPYSLVVLLLCLIEVGYS